MSVQGNDHIFLSSVFILLFIQSSMLFNSTTILFLAFLLAPGKKSNDKPRECIKAEASFCQKKGLASQSYGFSSSYVQM